MPPEIGGQQALPESPSVSIVVPVYNGAATLPVLVERVEGVFGPETERLEVIFVNDGSRDQSWQVIRQLSASHSRVKGIDLMRNYGQHNALLAGIRAASHEVVVTIDDDLQHPPEDIPKLLAKLAEGFDVVYGVPAVRRHMLWRNLASRTTKILLENVSGIKAKNVSAFRAFRRSASQSFADYRGPFVSIDVLLTWGTIRFGVVSVEHHARYQGQSNYTFGKLVAHALNIITGFSTLPLRLASLMGFAFSFLGLVVLFYVVGRYLYLGGTVPGFPFLASAVALFSGAQLFAIGIVGEYLARMYIHMLGKPTSVARDSVGFDVNQA